MCEVDPALGRRKVKKLSSFGLSKIKSHSRAMGEKVADRASERASERARDIGRELHDDVTNRAQGKLAASALFVSPQIGHLE